MTKALMSLFIILSLAIPVKAQELTPPEVSKSGQIFMPEETESFGSGLLELIQNGIRFFSSDLQEALHVNFGILAVTLMLSVFSVLTERIHPALSMAGAITIASMLFRNASGMIGYAVNILQEICEYGKLLCPVMTTALAAQGGIAVSAALYTGTMFFIALLSNLVSKILVPMVYLYLVFSVANAALENDLLKNIAQIIKKLVNWLLKTVLIVFTTYMSVTGVVSGTTDAAALKTAKLTISSVVPVVGSILSDASESVLISMGLIKNAAGIYGILAVLAIFAGPFIKVGVQYLILKGSALTCSVFRKSQISDLVDDFSAAIGILLAMVATGCTMILISTVCFLKGIG